MVQGHIGRAAITGDEWYSQQASRAVNQSCGRIIRHIGDYGAIILADERFAHGSNSNQLSAWLRPYLKRYSKFGEFVMSLAKFFNSAGSLRVDSEAMEKKPVVLLAPSIQPKLLQNAYQTKAHNVEKEEKKEREEKKEKRPVERIESLKEREEKRGGKEKAEREKQERQRQEKRKEEKIEKKKEEMKEVRREMRRRLMEK